MSTILANELNNFKSVVVSDLSANGGRMSGTNQITSGLKNNLWPDVDEDERAAGSTKYRKTFFKNANDELEIFTNPKLHMTEITNGDDIATIFEGTQSDTQGDIAGPREYGVGNLKTNVSAGASTFTITAEDTGLAIFVTADTVWLSDGTNSEYHENVTVVPSGVDFAITLDGADVLLNNYLASNTFGASVIEPGDIKPSFDNYVETSGSGTYDESTFPPVLDNIGTVEDTWTLTFSDAINYSCSGANEGAVGSGSTGGDFAPVNADFTKPFFTFLASGFGGTWAVGDTIVFQTHPAAVPIWQKRVVPIGATSVSNNDYTVRLKGETTGATTTTTTTSSTTTTTTTTTTGP